MANSKATIKLFAWPRGVDNTQRNIILRGTISIGPTGTANIYPAGGFPLDWTSVQSGAGYSASTGLVGNAVIPSSYTGTAKDSVLGDVVLLPTEVDVWSAANPPSGYTYVVDRSVGKLHVLVPSNGASGASGPMVEFGGVVPVAMQNDTIQFTAVLPLNV
jgi:hypothetical protein